MRLFVYGTLKRGGSNHHYLDGQRFVGEAATVARYRLHDLGGYPGMVAADEDGVSITGEVWEVDAQCLALLDVLEDTDGEEYVRELILLRPPFAEESVEGYRYLRSVAGCRDLGASW